MTPNESDLKAAEEFTLTDRLELLKQSGQIGDKALMTTKEVIRMIEEKYEIKLIEQRKHDAMFVTHVAIALQRLINGKEFAGVSLTVFEEVKAHGEEYEFTKNIVKMIEKRLNVKVPEVELAFIATYLCLLKMQEE